MDNNFTQEDAIKMMTKAIEIPIERREKEEEDTRKLLREQLRSKLMMQIKSVG